MAVHRLFTVEGAKARGAHRDKHANFVEGLGDRIVLAGSLLGPDGVPTGNFLLLDAVDENEARAVMADDPYEVAGLFATVTIQPYRIAHLHPPR